MTSSEPKAISPDLNQAQITSTELTRTLIDIEWYRRYMRPSDVRERVANARRLIERVSAYLSGFETEEFNAE